MRLTQSLILAGALLAASPALAQDNAAAPGNTVSTEGVDANIAANTTAPDTTTTSAATPGAQDATLPPEAPAADEAATTAPVEQHRGFPWGVLGLIGLIGLLGVRKVKG
jgi:hypothetical protein